jgi:hypothetical protein
VIARLIIAASRFKREAVSEEIFQVLNTSPEQRSDMDSWKVPTVLLFAGSHLCLFGWGE